MADTEQGTATTTAAAPKRFHSYQASANAFGGHLVRPVKSDLPTLASSCLPSVGGYHSARHDNFQFHEIVSIDQAYTHVGGSYNDQEKCWTTIASSVIKGLNVGHTLFADMIVGQISLTHPLDGGPATVSFLGSHFDGLRIGNRLLDPNLQLRLYDDVGSVDLSSADEAEPGTFLASARDQSNNLVQFWLDGKPANPGAKPEEQLGDNTSKKIADRGSVLCSIFDGIKPGSEKDGSFPSAWKTHAHAIKIPDFGYVFLGELEVRRGSFDLTMIRLSLGSPIQGGASGAQAAVAGGTKGGPVGNNSGTG